MTWNHFAPCVGKCVFRVFFSEALQITNCSFSVSENVHPRPGGCPPGCGVLASISPDLALGSAVERSVSVSCDWLEGLSFLPSGSAVTSLLCPGEGFSCVPELGSLGFLTLWVGDFQEVLRHFLCSGRLFLSVCSPPEHAGPLAALPSDVTETGHWAVSARPCFSGQFSALFSAEARPRPTAPQPAGGYAGQAGSAVPHRAQSGHGVAPGTCLWWNRMLCSGPWASFGGLGKSPICWGV